MTTFTPKSFNGTAINDGTNYEAKFIADSGGGLHRYDAKYNYGRKLPRYADKEWRERVISIVITMKGTVDTQRETLKRLFNPDDKSGEKQLIVSDQAAAEWYLYGTPIAVPDIAGPQFFVLLAVGNPIYKKNTETTDTWTVASSGSTRNVTPGGNRETFPIYRIKPLSAKTGGFGFQRFFPVSNQTTRAFTNYPFDIAGDAWDTAALVTASKMQADGDDLRVYVDGAEVNRWLDGINTTTTKVWINLNLSPKQEATLGTAIASSGAITSIVCSTSISGFPASGILLIDSEVFTYTSKTDSSNTFGGVTRAAKGSSMAAHSSGATVKWIEHDIVVYYGNSSLAAPTTDNTKKPIFNLATSTNTSWDYDDFRDGDASQSGIWTATGLDTSLPNAYTANHQTLADPAQEMGLATSTSYWPNWMLYHPAGVTNWNFANGEKYRATANWANANLRYGSTSGILSSTIGYSIPTPSASATWEAWSDSRALGATYFYIWIALQTITNGALTAIEVADVTLTLDSAGVPLTSIGAEQGSYNLSATLTNVTTGEFITLSYVMGLNETLEVDTENHTVTYLKDGSNAIAAINWSSSRDDWLQLIFATNQLKYGETGMATNGVEVKTVYRDRHS